ncbi:MAG: sigma-54 dependent transcriptional regulator [Candidatus Kapabacteria bacterium]|nr:sigma-54 dependent transcriptional regulator [Candidatus Kapabacteria bacterium]
MQVINSKYFDRDFYRSIQRKFGIIGSSEALLEVIHLLNQAAPTDLAVLIDGETGTGKEVFAKALHGLSKRKKFRFVSVNCGAIPENLLESELFGHEKGAFTSAVDKSQGFFEVADNGTIFLDEIGEMPLSTQVKLLRVLETGEFSSVGSSVVKQVNIRIVAATNRNLEQEVSKGNFRQDLYFRLKSVIIHLPPLRERPEDIPELVHFFASRACEKLGITFEGITPEAVNLLQNMSWPGNVRELRNTIETTIGLEQCSVIRPENLRSYITPALPSPQYFPIPPENSLIPQAPPVEPSEKLELEIIFRTLLDMQSQLKEMQRGMHGLAIKIDSVQAHLDDMTATEFTPTITTEHVSDDADNKSLNLADNEKELILTALRRFSGSRRLAAKALGISERTLYRKLGDYDILTGFNA